MSYYAATGGSAGAGAAAYATIANAVKASGAIIRLKTEEFHKILNKAENPLVVYAQGGFLEAKHKYLTAYKGFVFFTKCSEPLQFASSIEIVTSEKIWIPS